MEGKWENISSENNTVSKDERKFMCHLSGDLTSYKLNYVPSSSHNIYFIGTTCFLSSQTEGGIVAFLYSFHFQCYVWNIIANQYLKLVGLDCVIGYEI